MKRRDLLQSAAFVAVGTMLPRVALAAKANNTLNVPLTFGIENIDRYFNSVVDGGIIARHIWDTLIYRDPVSFEYKPALATAWRWVDDKTLEFDLRQGVKFHNGDDFDADDVVYTLNFVSNPANKAVGQDNVNFIRTAEKVSQFKVRVHLKHPFPPALEYVSGEWPIYPGKYYEKVGPTGMGQKPVGTGPYRVVSLVPSREFVLERFDGHFKESPKLQKGGNIKRIQARLIADMATQVAELLGGGIDWMWYVPADQAEQLAQVPNLTVVNEQVFRTGSLVIDATGRSGVPALKDKRVRKAIAHAIDRQSMIDNLVKGKSKILNVPCYPTQFGCNSAKAVVYDFNPQKARALLKEAGFENGFSVDMYAWRSREWSEAIVSYLGNVGIRVNLRQMDYFAIRDLMRAGKTPITFIDDGYYRLNDSATIWQRFFAKTPDDQAHDDEVKAWVEQAATINDPQKRIALYDQIIAKVTDEAYWAPLFTFSANYAFSKDLEFTPNIDEMPRWYNARWT